MDDIRSCLLTTYTIFFVWLWVLEIRYCFGGNCGIPLLLSGYSLQIYTSTHNEMFLKPEGIGEIPPAAPGPTAIAVSKYYNVRTRILRYRHGGVSSYT